MKKGSFKVFLILKGSKREEHEPKHVFIDTDREHAKLYMNNWLKENNEYGLFNLYEIHNRLGTESFKTNIFIHSTWNNKKETTNIYDEMTRIKKASAEKEMQKQIEILFDARKMENFNTIKPEKNNNDKKEISKTY